MQESLENLTDDAKDDRDWPWFQMFKPDKDSESIEANDEFGTFTVCTLHGQYPERHDNATLIMAAPVMRKWIEDAMAIVEDEHGVLAASLRKRHKEIMEKLDCPGAAEPQQ